MNVADLIRRHAQRTPEAHAYLGAYGAVATYAVLEQTINAVAHRLREIGLVPGQTAVLVTPDLYKHIAVAMALARIGVAHAPVQLPAHLTDIAIIDGDQKGNGCPRTITLEDIAPRNLAALAKVPPAESHEGGAAAFVHYPSSGTTGRPKFTSISHHLALRRADRDALGLAGGRGTAALRQACHLVPGTSYGFSSLLIALSGGGTVLEPAVAPAEVPQWLVASRANYLVTSPILLFKTAESLPKLRGPNSLATIEVGGGALPQNVYELARERLCPNITVNYGSTECGRVAWMPGDVAQRQPGAVGYPYPGVEIEIVDESDRLLTAGTEGIVRIRSEQNASGYLDDPETTAAVFRNGWIYPGDRGVLAPDGLLRITGRVDDVINHGGVKISPLGVETALMALADLREVAVFGLTDANGVSHVCAAIVPAQPLDAQAFSEKCREQLGVTAPVLIMQVNALPRNANGKVVRTELVRLAQEASRARSTVH